MPSQTKSFDQTVLSKFSAWLRTLPSDTSAVTSLLETRRDEVSWADFYLLLSDLISSMETDMPGHSRRVSHLALRCGTALGLQPAELCELYWGSALHDIGKLELEPDMLHKSDILSEREWQFVREHPKRGHDILLSLLENREVADVALTHHEHWDGTGYPNGLVGDNIPLLGRIVALCDAFDALTMGRLYRPAVSVSKAAQIIKKDAGTHFDPCLTEQLVDCLVSAGGWLSRERRRSC